MPPDPPRRACFTHCQFYMHHLLSQETFHPSNPTELNPPPPPTNLEILLKCVSGAAQNKKFGHMLIWDAHLFLCNIFMPFPALHFGLAHSGSRPFI